MVEPGDTVQFTDLSNDADSWEWDFDNDGIVDSYEQNPIYIYQDTGYYTVKLKIQWFSVEDYAIRYDYIHVADLTNVVETEPEVNAELLCYPNPFKEKVTIVYTIPECHDPGYILIYDILGGLINKLKLEKDGFKNEYNTSWDGRDKNGYKVKPGIYYYQLKSNRSISKKILLIN